LPGTDNRLIRLRRSRGGRAGNATCTPETPVLPKGRGTVICPAADMNQRRNHSDGRRTGKRHNRKPETQNPKPKT
jgi:hypothetical protein